MHHAPLALLPTWLDAQHILDSLGPWALWGAVAIIFAECGLLIGFLLPGDSLLFTVGLLISSGVIGEPIWLACAVLAVAAFVGNVVGYEIGRRTGPAIFSKEDSRIFKKEHVDKTVAFFDKYGSRAIVLARFVPIVRTFITVTAGVGRMDRRRFLTYSGIGGTAWAGGVTLLGSLLGKIDFVKNNLEAMLLSIVLISVVPIGIEYLRERAKSRRGEDVAAPPPLPDPETAAGAGQQPHGPQQPGQTSWTPQHPAWLAEELNWETQPRHPVWDAPQNGAQAPQATQAPQIPPRPGAGQPWDTTGGWPVDPARQAEAARAAEPAWPAGQPWPTAPAPRQAEPQASWQDAEPQPQASWHAEQQPQASWHAEQQPQASWQAEQQPQASWQAEQQPQASWQDAETQDWRTAPQPGWGPDTPGPGQTRPSGGGGRHVN